ncbi:ribonucleoside-diphosphate reductase alpha chain [Streptosporangium becharense]|uniref:Ribonucleoside-diphosphate reductase n=1 Tax=Streptosporangium becharense TaxID=1816182 RepID=A0A7W9MJM4_9ACTN|nr:ribonucleoside-diphosphate reductase subunit alpha [Streptosporangium becharense]MBB2911449.1 ribonucleoside-diphosphate reductase alpha chain [Streptosporangium becharense]MBB5822733.1 ribonucleoside-diphosphate reductase alpha chain [Streptosporangium becharense]
MTHTVVDAAGETAGTGGQDAAGRDAGTGIRGTRTGGTGGASEADRRLAIDEAAARVITDPENSRVAAGLLAGLIADEAAGHGVLSFSDSVAATHAAGLVADRLAEFVAVNAAALDALVDTGADDRFEYFGLRTVYDRYLLRHPETRRVLERPQHFFLRVACGLSETVSEAAELYRLMATLSYLPSSPTLFNSGARRPQLSSCFLLDSPRDELEAVYERYGQVARLSKYAGGIGISWSRVRSRGSLIRGTNGHSNGIVPWLRTLDASVAAVNQGGRRKGAACVYLETWHADIEEFLELRDNTGEDARRTHNLNLANWIPDEFMRRVEADGTWSLFDPKDVPHLVDLYGAAFDEAYRAAEAEGRFVRRIPARTLYGRMMRTLAQTGNGWMTFKDAANRTSNQTARPGNVIHLSNLCTEILEVTSDAETAVCNLGSVNLAAHLDASGGDLDWTRLRATVRTAVRFLDRTIDLGFYPTSEAEAANRRWRPIGLGVMGLADVLFALRLPFDALEAMALSTRISEEIALAAYATSADLAVERGRHPSYDDTRAAAGVLHPDHYGAGTSAEWTTLRERIAVTGLRNSLMVAIAPTATIASIAGCYECIEPQVSNVFKRETLSGEFLQVNRYLVRDLSARGLWTPQIRDAIKAADGSVQDIPQIPADLRLLYRTAWELPQKALIDLAAARAPYIDQSQSLNLFMATPTIGKLSSMYAYAWKSGLKTTYYLRSRPATRIAQATVASSAASPVRPAAPGGPVPDPEAVACSLENPEYCDACQ